MRVRVSQPIIGVPAEVPFLLLPQFRPLVTVGEGVVVGLMVGRQAAFVFQ